MKKSKQKFGDQYKIIGNTLISTKFDIPHVTAAANHQYAKIPQQTADKFNSINLIVLI